MARKGDRATDPLFVVGGSGASAGATEVTQQEVADLLRNRNNDFATLLNYLPKATTDRLLRDPGPAAGAGFSYHGRNTVRDALESVATWEVVRFELDTAQEIVDTQYASGIAWDDRATASHWD